MPLETLAGSPYLGTSRNPYNYQKIEQIDRDISTAWLTLDEITQQLNLFQDESQDSYLSSIELATRMAIEDYLGVAIFPVTYRISYGAMNGLGGDQVALDLPEVSTGYQGEDGITIESVGYWNSANPPVFVPLASTDYFHDATGNKVIVSGLPSAVNTQMSNPIVVTYTTNPSFIAQYPVVKQAGLMLLTHIYNQRSNTTEAKLNEIPFGVAQLLRPYRPLVM